MATRADLVVNTALVVITAVFILGLARLFWLIGEIVLLVLIAAILATGLNPLVERVQRARWPRGGHRPSRGAAIAVVYVCLLLVLGIIGTVLVTPVVTETQEFVQRAPQLYETLRRMVADFDARYPWLPDLGPIIDRLPQEANRLTAYVGTATGVAFRVFGAVVSAITVLILSIYMLLEGPAMRRGFLALFPRARHQQIEHVLDGVGLKFGGWLRGQLLLGVIIGVAAGLGTWSLGLPYPFLLGLAAGITELVPMIGPVLGAIPAVLIALFGPLWKLLAVVALFTLIQQLENNLLVPRVMRQTVGLSPLLTIVAIMVGARLLGVLGALLAVPVAAALQVVVAELLRAFRLGSAAPPR